MRVEINSSVEAQLKAVAIAEQSKQFSFDYVLFRDKLLSDKETCIEMGLKPGDELLGV